MTYLITGIVIALLLVGLYLRRRLRKEGAPRVAPATAPLRMPPRPVPGLARSQLRSLECTPAVLTAFWQSDGRLGLRARCADKELISLNGGKDFYLVQRNRMRIVGDASNYLDLLPPIAGLDAVMQFVACHGPLTMAQRGGLVEEVLLNAGISIEPEVDPLAPAPAS